MGFSLCNLSSGCDPPLSLSVFPGAWTAILVSLDNVGIWNLRAENLDSWYLGQEVYISVTNPEVNKQTELPLPDNAIFCGALAGLQQQQLNKYRFSGASSAVPNILFSLLLSCLCL